MIKSISGPFTYPIGCNDNFILVNFFFLRKMRLVFLEDDKKKNEKIQLNCEGNRWVLKIKGALFLWDEVI